MSLCPPVYFDAITLDHAQFAACQMETQDGRV